MTKETNPYEAPAGTGATAEVSAPSTLRLVLFSLSVFAGVAAILMERFVFVGILVFALSHIILQSNSQRKKQWSTPLSKRGVVRVVTFCVVLYSLLGLLVYWLGKGAAPFEATTDSVTMIGRWICLIAAGFMVGQPWIRWFQHRNLAIELDDTE